MLHTEELPRPEGCIFRTACASDQIAIVGLLAFHGGAGEAVSATEAAGERRHHDVAGNCADDEGGGDYEPLGHEDHHEEGEKGTNVGSSFRIIQLADESRGHPGDGREDPCDHDRVDREGDKRG